METKPTHKKAYIFILRHLGLTLLNQGEHKDGIEFYVKSQEIEKKTVVNDPRYKKQDMETIEKE